MGRGLRIWHALLIEVAYLTIHETLAKMRVCGNMLMSLGKMPSKGILEGTIGRLDAPRIRHCRKSVARVKRGEDGDGFGGRT
jgi:hypothetical protein